MNKFIKTNDGTISLSIEGRSFVVSKDHPNYDKIVKNLRSPTLTKLLDIKTQIRKIRDIEIHPDGSILFRRLPINGKIVPLILKALKNKKSIRKFENFLAHLAKNPSRSSMDQLFDFLSNGEFEILDSGHFLGWKYIGGNWKDCHTGTISNKVNNVVKMNRSDVLDDPKISCGPGLHVGTEDYAFENCPQSGRIVKVIVNPEHVVSVPTNESTKLRVCEYRVLEEVSK